jgi:hypothetical protein
MTCAAALHSASPAALAPIPGTPIRGIQYELGTLSRAPRRITRSGGSVGIDYGYDAVSRLATLGQRFPATGNNLFQSFVYNPASQVTSETKDNDAFAFTANTNVNRNYTSNGLNQLTSAGPASLAYDARGNLTSDGTASYVYDHENRLVHASGPTSLSLYYDPLGRLWKTQEDVTQAIKSFVHDPSGGIIARACRRRCVRRALWRAH